MPLYEYECKCGWKAERLMTPIMTGVMRCGETGRLVMGDKIRCPLCKRLARKVQHPGGAFKLKGWWPGKGGN